MSIKEAVEKVKETAKDVRRSVVDLVLSMPRPMYERPTIVLRKPIVKRVVGPMVESIRRRLSEHLKPEQG